MRLDVGSQILDLGRCHHRKQFSSRMHRQEITPRHIAPSPVAGGGLQQAPLARTPFPAELIAVEIAFFEGRGRLGAQ
jgi:hypothetical protein